MSSIKVSELTAKTTPAGTEELLINDGGTSKKITIDNVTENNFTDTLKTKLDAIEASATADQTGSEIKAAYEAEANAYTDTKDTKLSGIATSANNYSLPTASASTLGGIKVGTNLSIASGVLSSTDTNTTYTASGLVAIDGSNNITTTANNYSHPTGAGNEHLPSTVSQTEAGYLDGVTSAIQTQLNTKLASGGTLATATITTLTSTTANITTIDLGNWTVTESAGVLYFASSGTNKAKLDASGNFTCTGDVISNGTV